MKGSSKPFRTSVVPLPQRLTYLKTEQFPPLRTLLQSLRLARRDREYLRQCQGSACPGQQRKTSFAFWGNSRHKQADIADQVLNQKSNVFSSMSTSIQGSAGRLGRMAQQGNKVAILKLSAMIVGAVIVLWWVLSFIFRSGKT